MQFLGSTRMINLFLPALLLAACGGGSPAPGDDGTPSGPLETTSKPLAVPLPGNATQTTLTPTADDLQGLRKSGRIDAKSGQLIENLDISNPQGPCVVVGAGVRNVTIRRSRIGPCGPSGGSTDYGIFILEGATNIVVQSNVIHDVASGVKAHRSTSPLVIDRNYFFNIRGPHYNGQAVQFNAVSGGNSPSKVTCNVSDANYGTGVKGYEDHISMYAASGMPSAPIEIAYNRIRGGTSKEGGGITVGDNGGSWIWVHDNVVVTVTNTGIGVAGGNQILVENNRVDNRGTAPSSLTYLAYYVRALSACSNITIRGNRGTARLWNWNENDGALSFAFRNGPEMCSRVTDDANQFLDTSLSPAMFDEKPAACN
ncbi:right-handed parallel beta-helix repeat-containing protein [Burkholderiaceae bacterium UC74_6]